MGNIKVNIVPPIPEDFEREGVAPEKQIVEIEDNRYRIAWNKRLRLHIENAGEKEEKIVIEFEGQPAMMDSPYVKDHSNGEWRPIAGLSDGNKVLIWLRVPPGLTDFSVLPPYTYEDCEELVKRVSDDPRVNVTVPGKSAEGRNLWLLKIAEPGCNEEQNALKRRCLIASTAHSWETAGNYCVEGIVDYLLSNDCRTAMYLQLFDIYICPMLNPDGVANGVRRHLENGADLNRDIETNKTRGTGCENDPELVCHFKVIDELEPDIYAQIHNMSQKHRDCLLGMEPEYADIFTGFMPSMEKHLKLFGVDRGAEGTAPKYCYKKDRSCVACTFEFPWFGRTTKHMQEVGPMALEALLNTKIWIDQKKKTPAKYPNREA